MIANSIHVYIVMLPGRDGGSLSPEPSRSRDRLREIDPYIAGLISRLQREVRNERRSPPMPGSSRWPRSVDPLGEAPPPWIESPTEFDLPDRDEHWPLLGDMDFEEN